MTDTQTTRWRREATWLHHDCVREVCSDEYARGYHNALATQQSIGH